MLRPTRPTNCTNDMLGFLDRLRDSGKTNMFGATRWLLDYYDEITAVEARKILVYWMDTYSERHPEE